MAAAQKKASALRELATYGSLEDVCKELQDDKDVVMFAIQKKYNHHKSNFKYHHSMQPKSAFDGRVL